MPLYIIIMGSYANSARFLKLKGYIQTLGTRSLNRKVSSQTNGQRKANLKDSIGIWRNTFGNISVCLLVVVIRGPTKKDMMNDRKFLNYFFCGRSQSLS